MLIIEIERQPRRRYAMALWAPVVAFVAGHGQLLGSLFATAILVAVFVGRRVSYGRWN